MPVANLTQFEAGSVYELFDIELAGSTIISGTTTSAVLQRPSSAIEIRLTGTGFAYDGTPTFNSGESATSGTISQLEFWDGSNLVLRVTGLSILAVALQSALEDIDTGGDYAAFNAIFDAYTINYDGTAVPFEAPIDVVGSAGADSYALGLGDYFISPGDGADTINAGTTSSYTQINYSDLSGGGITVNWAAGTIIDPGGSTDTFTGRVDAVRGTNAVDTVNGDDNNNMFRGLGGNDFFDGGGGTDEVRYDRDANNGGTSGVTVNLATGIATDGFGDTDTLVSVERVRGTDFADLLIGNDSNNRIIGFDGDDTLRGAGGDDELDGGAGNDIIFTGSGDNYVNGSIGDDTINVETGIGVYIGYHDLDADITVQVSGTGASVFKGANGTDTILGLGNLDYDIGGNGFEGTSFGDSFTVNGLVDQFTGIASRGGDDTITNSGAGFVRADYRPDGNNSGSGITYISDDGNGVSGTVTGAGTGVDTLVNLNEIRGTDFDDTFTGGSGDERFILRGGNDTVNGGGGTDMVRFDRNGMGAVTVNLSAGTATGLFNGTSFSHTLSNIEIIRGSNDFGDTITGSGANETLDGRGGNDIINGGSGNDILSGGDGNDTMTGGLGNDTFYVDSSGDVVVEDTAGGTDLVYTSISLTLAANVENGILTGTAGTFIAGNELANTIVGNIGNNILNGRGGADRMFGGTGDDIYIVENSGDLVGEGLNAGDDTIQTLVSLNLAANVENLQMLGSGNINAGGNNLNNTMVGNAGNNIMNGGSGNDVIVGDSGNDTLVGAAGNDALNGGTGNDNMAGGAGNDTYYVDSVNDTVVEITSEGTDIIRTTVSLTLAENVENGQIWSSAALYLAGNELDNTLLGNAAVNTLNGRAGADRMFGYGGNDTYVVDDAGDVVGEAAGNGIDTVLTAVSRNLDANVERMTLLGTGNINAGGNELDNVIIGNGGSNRINASTGNDTIKGDGGADYLTGAAGNDTFVFSALTDSGSSSLTRDRILDFTIGEDTIYLASIDANLVSAGNQAFALDTDNSFSAGEIRQTQYGANLLLEMNVDNDEIAEMSILLLNSGFLSNDDFVF
ncbi:calcium-binding protein [Roseibium sp. FZY0029]|uniref:beta strand repeat-containing protein n=1 Tax=Roseibium sp. FZY0029 TaxID=3116647 RepID=UPI002EAD0CA5|nr:calcium-binding protein [Roseibium sp. FZY0029]